MDCRKILVSSIFAAVLATIAVGFAGAEKKTVTVKGYVIDSACVFIKNLKKPVGVDCARACANAGSPLVILADDGTIYWPISNAMPATGQNPRLLKFAGKRVEVRGQVFERGGSYALVIEHIEAAATRNY